MIYLLQDSYKDDNGNYQDILKIGYSKDHFSKSRQSQYDTHNFGYKILGEKEGSPELENYLHKVLKRFNLGREWFKYDQEVIDKFWNTGESDISGFTSQEDLNEYIRFYILKTLVPSVNKLRKSYQQEILDEIKEKCENSEDFEYDEELYTREIIRAFSWICQKETEYFEKLNFSIPDIQEKLIESNLVLPQRNRENPFKNNVVIFYRTIRKTEIQDRETFDKTQESRRNETKKLLEGFNLLTSDQKQAYIYINFGLTLNSPNMKEILYPSQRRQENRFIILS